MSCAHPLEILPKYKYPDSELYTRYVTVPCGYCVNCRRDAQNYIVDRATFEYCQRLTASFVTFTYDDVHLIEHCAVKDEYGFVYDTNDKGEKIIRTSLNYKDLTDFINNIRHYIVRHPELHNILCQPDFSYLYCGEYGDSFGRCHFHVLFFGLDFAYCKKIIFEKWKYGFIDVLPLLDGGIRYVTKYMDKFEKGTLAELKYDFKGITRPRLSMSQGFGQGLLWNNVKEIIKNDYCYTAKHNTLRPISPYWKKLLTGGLWTRDVTKKDFLYKKNEYLEKIRTQKITDLKNYKHSIDWRSITDLSLNDFSLRKSKIRESKIITQLHNNLVPVSEYESCIRSRFGFVTYDGKRLRRASEKVKRGLISLYFDELYSQVPNYFVSVGG